MDSITHLISQGFNNIAPLFILLGLLIFVHELGHFLVARWCGVRVEVFSLGFGRKIFQWKPGETTYCVSLIPLGGYVKMYGDDPTAVVPPEMRAKAFLHKSVSQRIAIVLAGPLMNLFFAFFLFMIISGVGEEMPGPMVGDVTANSAAYNAGFRSGDKIVRIGEDPVVSWTEVQNKIESSAGESLKFEVKHQDSNDDSQIVAQITSGPSDNLFSLNPTVGRIDGLSNESEAAVVGIRPGSVAEKAGLKTMDLITEVQNQKVNSFFELEKKLKVASGTTNLKVRAVESDDKPENYRNVSIEISGQTPLATLGIESSELYIASIKAKSPAATAGLQPKDRIVKVGGEEVFSWADVYNRVKAYAPEKGDMDFEVARGTETIELKMKPELTSLTNAKGLDEKRYTVGIISGSVRIGPDPVLVRATDPIKIVKRGLSQTTELTGLMVMGLVRMAQGQVSAKNIGGVITIGRVASRSFEIGFSAFLKTMALISLNLFLLNLLPVPVLDGGHLLFFSIEALKGTPISLRKLEIAQQVGLTLLMILMAFAFFNDITNLFAARW